MTCRTAIAGLLLLAASLPVPARADQPRVFFAPEERPTLTAQRRRLLQQGGQATTLAPAVAAAEGETSPAAPRRAARLDGISLAQDGRAVAWIGGRRYEDGAPLAGYRLRVTRDGVRLVGSQGEGRLLKVGQNVGGVWVAAEPAP